MSEKFTIKETYNLVRDIPVNTAIIAAHENDWDYEKELEAQDTLEWFLAVNGYIYLAILGYTVFKVTRGVKKIKRKRK